MSEFAAALGWFSFSIAIILFTLSSVMLSAFVSEKTTFKALNEALQVKPFDQMMALAEHTALANRNQLLLDLSEKLQLVTFLPLVLGIFFVALSIASR